MLAALLVPAWLCVGCAPGTAGSDGPAMTRPAEPVATTRSAEDLDRMLLDRPSVPVTEPQGGAAPREPASELPAEGSMVIDRRCRLRGGEAGWVLLQFDHESDRPDVRDRRALPCRLLERMEDLDGEHRAARFRVSGETTVFDDRAYLLPRKATLERPQEPAAEAATTRPATQPATVPATGPTATAPAATAADEIIGKLLQEQPGKPVIARGVETQTGMGYVVDRLVRILPDDRGRWWLARFESDNTLSDEPVRLLPCKLLERARAMAMGSDGGLIFRVSGELTRYKGRSYLLLRKVLRERDLGRL
jgi:hypothetical protein